MKKLEKLKIKSSLLEQYLKDSNINDFLNKQHNQKIEDEVLKKTNKEMIDRRK